MQRLACALCLGSALISVTSARAQTLVLRLSGISGESQVAGHQKDIDVGSFSWSIAKPVVNGQSGPVTLSPLTVTKPVDLSSPALAQACATGTGISAGTLYCFRQQYGTNAHFYDIVCKNLLVTSVQSAAPGYVPPANTPSASATQFETLTLTFSSIQWIYYPASGSQVSATYP